MDGAFHPYSFSAFLIFPNFPDKLLDIVRFHVISFLLYILFII